MSTLKKKQSIKVEDQIFHDTEIRAREGLEDLIGNQNCLIFTFETIH